MNRSTLQRHNNSIVVWLMTAVIAFFTSASFAASPRLNTLDEHSSPLVAQFDYFEDSEKKHTLESLAQLSDSDWKAATEGNASFGFSLSQFWLRLGVDNNSSTTKNMLLEVAYPLLDDITFYAQKTNGEVRTLATGDGKAFYPRDIDHPSMLFRFQLHDGEKVNLYAKVQSNGSMILPLKLWQEKDFFEFAAKEQKFHFFYYGALAVIVLINFAIFFTLREKLYLFYSLSTLGYLVFFLTSRGYGQQLFFPGAPELNSQVFLSSIPLLALFSLLFAREFLRTKEHSPKIDMALRAMIYFEYFNLVASFILDYNSAVKLSALSVVAFFSVLFVSGPVSWHAGKREGIFFTIAWVPLTLGVFATAGRTSGLLPNNFVTEYAMQLGSGLEAFILTLALADRLYREREDKILAQATSIQKDKQRLAAQNELSEAMVRDPITQLANGNRFEWLVNKVINEQPDERFVICVARVTRINEITRTLGLSSVETILRSTTAGMNVRVSTLPGVISSTNSKNGNDALFQLTRDTFGIVINQRVCENNLEHYHAFTQELSSPIEVELLSIELEPRIGCALFPAHGQEASQLIRNAIVAMESSHHATNQVGYYDHSLDIYNESRLTLMSDLREALKNDEPDLHYQPKLDLSSNEVVGLEALIRWQHVQRGFVSPAEFVPLAEQTGVIRQLTLWAIERAAKDLLSLRAQGYTGNMSINISTKDLLSEQLKDQISAILEKYQVDPSRVFLELTETSAMDEPEASLKALDQLKSMGLQISIDDFGTGYSSLSYLKQLPASEIKLDRSLIKDITESESARLIVKASIEMAHGLGCLVVAEGVEDYESAQILKALKCDKLQGFWLCKPKPVDEIAEWLSAR